MTTTHAGDLVADFRVHLGGRVRAQLRDTGRLTVLAHRAIHTHGWTVEALAAECMRDHGGAINPAGIVMHRLEWCADNPPPIVAGRVRRPLCGRCEDGFEVDPRTRAPIRRCPCRSTT